MNDLLFDLKKQYDNARRTVFNMEKSESQYWDRAAVNEAELGQFKLV